MKILVVGFGRSGTTLTYRTFVKHPEIKRGFLETCLLAFNDKKNLYKNYPVFNNQNKGVVEKVIYSGDRIAKKGFVLNITIYDYCNMWLDYFGKEARIVQIIRHPLDTISSLIIKRGRRRKIRPDLKDITVTDIPLKERNELAERYLYAVSKYPKMIASLKNTKTFKYEDMILKPETIQNMFSFCNLGPGNHESLRKDRAFNYKRTDFKVEQSIGKVIKIFNEISDGVKYKGI